MNITIDSVLIFLVGSILGFIVRFIYAKIIFNSVDMKTKQSLYTLSEKEASLKKELTSFENKQGEQRKRFNADKQQIQDSKNRIYSEQQALSRLEAKLDSQKQQVEHREKHLAQQEKLLADKLSSLEEERLSTQKTLEKQFSDKMNSLEEERLSIQKTLENITRLSKEEATEILLQQLEKNLEKEMADVILKKEESTKSQSKAIAQDIILNSISRLATEVSSESVVTSVILPSDDMKGRIIGREGRNIRALEISTGVDIIIDDTPESILVSCFDPIRREIARITIERLINDKRIQPSRIEEIHTKVKSEIKQTILKEGEEACYSLGLHDLHKDMIQYIGRMKYRTSYGQNLLAHSIEVAQLSSMIAQDLGLNSTLALRGGFLHDVGKVIMDDDRGHVQAGFDLAKKLGESEEILNCILAHHEEVPHSCPESMVVRIADAISASRPGARKDSFERYVERLTNLENIALEFNNIQKAFAIQAGRELRIIVNSDEISDDSAQILARDVANEIESKLHYPGQIKVSVFRETRFTEYAR